MQARIALARGLRLFLHQERADHGQQLTIKRFCNGLAIASLLRCFAAPSRGRQPTCCWPVTFIPIRPMICIKAFRISAAPDIA